MSINQQESHDAESDAQGARDKEGNEIKVEVGIQTDELFRSCKYGCDLIKDNDTATKFYTGLPSWDMYMLIFNFIGPCIPNLGQN